MPIIGVFFDRMEAERDVRPGEKIPPLKSVQHIIEFGLLIKLH